MSDSRAREVLFLIPRMNGGGAERVLGILADEFAENGWDTTIMLSNQTKEEMVGYRIKESVSVMSMMDIQVLNNKAERKKYRFMMNKTRIWGTLCEIFHLNIADRLAYETFICQYNEKISTLRKYLIAHPQTVVIAFLQPAVNIALLAADSLDNKIIISERADPARYSLNRYMPYFAKKWYPKASKIVFQTDTAQAYFDDEVKKISSVIPNPLNPNLPKAYHGQRRNVIVNFCRITSQKNLKLLIDAFELFVKEYPEYCLEIWGEGEKENEIREYIIKKRLDEKISLKPFDGMLHKKIQDCAMFVSSSDYEGMSNSMIEALAIGLPTICTDCPAGGARAIIQNHYNGILVPVGDKSALCSAMKEVASSTELANRLSKHGAELRDELNVEAIASKWMKLLN